MNEAIALSIAIICFILAAAGIGLLVWMFRDKIVPLVPSPKRHWFRFSLRTWVVAFTLVALFLGWLGSNLHQARQRRILISYIRRGAGFGDAIESRQQYPILWRLLGYPPMILEIELPRQRFTEEERQTLQDIYPEVEVNFVDRTPRITVSSQEIDEAERLWDD
jgi:hypothetical protein